MVCDRVFDHLDQLHTGICCCDAVLMQQLDHEPRKPFESSWNASGRVQLYQHVLRSSNKNLKKPCSVKRRVKEHEQTLVCDVRSGSRKVAIIS